MVSAVASVGFRMIAARRVAADRTALLVFIVRSSFDLGRKFGHGKVVIIPNPGASGKIEHLYRWSRAQIAPVAGECYHNDLDAAGWAPFEGPGPSRIQ
jgi:hypothetical protein